MIAYLDRNVLSHLRQGTSGASPEDEIILRAAIKHGTLVLPLSIVTLSETLLMENTKQALHEIRWIVGLVGRSHIINDTVPLLDDCLRSYGSGRIAPSPYVTLDLARVTSPTARDVGALLKTMLTYKRQRIAWTDNWTHALETWKGEMPPRLMFKEFLVAHAVGWLQTMAERARVFTECNRRGWDGLLALKAIRLGVVVPLVLAHAKMFRDSELRNGELEEAHFGDLHHVVAATPADVFVTHDGRLRGLIHQANVPDLEVLTLPQLVRRLKAIREAGGNAPCSPGNP